jgi:Fe-S-cluster-containing hydrogenase component 2
MTRIDTNKCTRSGGYIDLCPTIAISMINDVVTVSKELCTGCSICIRVCPIRAPYEEKE